MPMAVDMMGNHLPVQPTRTPAQQAAQAATAAAHETDAAAAAARPVGNSYSRNPSQQNRDEFVQAYTPVYQSVVHEMELLVDSGMDADTAAKQIKQRHLDDPALGKVVDIATDRVRGESAQARHTNRVLYEGRPAFEQAMQARDKATQTLDSIDSHPWVGGSSITYDRQTQPLRNTIEQSTTTINSYLGNVNHALGMEVDSEARHIATQNGRSAPNVEDYAVASEHISQQHEDPLLDALLPDVTTDRPGYASAVSDLDGMLNAEAQRIANERHAGTVSREDHEQAGKNLIPQMPRSAALISQRAQFLAGQSELRDIQKNADNPTLPVPPAAGDTAAPLTRLAKIQALAKDDPVSFWGLQQATRHGIVFDPYNLQLPQFFAETQVDATAGQGATKYRIGTDPNGNARWATEQELRNLAINEPHKFAMFALGMRDKTALGVSGNEAVQSIMSTQVLLRHDDTAHRAGDKFRLGEEAWARGDHGAARSLWNESLTIIATNQRQASTQEEARQLGDISNSLFTTSWLSRKTDELPAGRNGKIEEWGQFINDLTKNTDPAKKSSVPPQFANTALDVYRSKFDPSWIQLNAQGDAQGVQLYKALSRLTEVTGRAPEFAALLTDPVYGPIFRYMHRSEYKGMQEAIADPEGGNPNGNTALTRAYLAHPHAFQGMNGDNPHLQFDREEIANLVTDVGWIANNAEERAPQVVGMQNAQQLSQIQLTSFDKDQSKTLHQYFDTFTDPARRPQHFSVDAPLTLDTDNQLINYLGWTLGMKSSRDFSLLDGDDDEAWFTSSQQHALKDLLKAIREHVGGAQVQIQAAPFVYVDQTHKQYVESSLYVVTVDGKETIFNERGAKFDSWDAYFTGNDFSDKGRLYLLKQNQPRILQASAAQYDRKDFDDQIESRRANEHTNFEAFKDGFKDVTTIEFDDAVAYASLAVGVAAVPFGGVALALIALGGALYSAAVAADDLLTLDRNGYDIFNFSDDQVRSNWENLAVTAFTLAVPALKLARLRSLNAANASSGIATVANLGVNADQVNVLINQWDQLTVGERWNQSILTFGGVVAEPASRVLHNHVKARRAAQSSSTTQQPSEQVGLLLGPDRGALTDADGIPVLLALDAKGMPLTDSDGRILHWQLQPNGRYAKGAFDITRVDHFNKRKPVVDERTTVDDTTPMDRVEPLVSHLPPVRKHGGEHLVNVAAASPTPTPHPEIHRVVNPYSRRGGSSRPGAHQNGRPGDRSDSTRPHHSAGRPDNRGGGVSSAGNNRGTDPDSGVLATVGAGPSSQSGAAVAPVFNPVHVKLADAAEVTGQADFGSRYDVTAGSDGPRIVNSAQPPDENNSPDRLGGASGKGPSSGTPDPDANVAASDPSASKRGSIRNWKIATAVSRLLGRARGVHPERGEWVERPKPILANATYLLDNTKMLINERDVEIHPDHIPTDYSSAVELDRAERITNNLRLDMNMFYEEHLQRELEHHPAFTDDAKKAVELIHDMLAFSSLDMAGAEAIHADLREVQIENLTRSLEGSYPEGALRDFLEKNDWTESNFKDFLNSFTGEEGRPRQVADTDMKVLKQIKTQVPYFGGSIEYHQNVKGSLEYYIYHISTLTRDANQQYGIGTPQGDLLPKDLKAYNTRAEGEVPFNNLRNLGTGVVESPFSKLPKNLQDQIENEIKHLREDIDANERGRASALQDFEEKLGQQQTKLTAQEIWDRSDEDGKKKLFADILRLPWSDAHLHGGTGYEQVTSPDDLRGGRSTSHILQVLPPRPDEQPGLMNVAGVHANVLEQPEVAGSQYADDPRFAKLEEVKQEGTLEELFPGAVPPDRTLQQEFVEKHRNWHERAMANFKPQIGGISGHTLGYMNLYAEALDRVPESERGQYPSPERLRAIMLAGLIGTKRHHSYDEVMSASTGTGKGSIPAESYRAPTSYGDVLKSADPEIRACALAALKKAQRRYVRERNTVLTTIMEAVTTANPNEAQAINMELTNAAKKYLKKLGHDQDGTRLSNAVAGALTRRAGH